MLKQTLNFLKKPFIIAPLILVLAVSIFFFIQNKKTSPKCPDDYANDDAGSAEYVADMDKWTNDFFDNHRGASLEDWATARHQFWIDNKCVAALQRYEDSKSQQNDDIFTYFIKSVIF
jgi:hypothetical protein